MIQKLVLNKNKSALSLRSAERKLSQAFLKRFVAIEKS